MQNLSLMAPCPGCKGVGQLMARVNYRSKGCRDELRDCPICNGAKEITLMEAIAFERKYGSAQGKEGEQ